MMKVYHWVKKSQAVMFAWRIVAESEHYIWFEDVGTNAPHAIKKTDLITIEHV